MQNTNNYWNKKEERKVEAKKHTEKMATEHGSEINLSAERARKYDENSKFLPAVGGNNTVFVLKNTDSVSAIFGEDNNNLAVLNFASYKTPGGMFLAGSGAQEECLCHESFLYNVLVKFEDTYYAENGKAKNKALYLNRALYSPDILFERGDKKRYCNVLTCAAPNLTAAKKYCNVSDKENSEVLASRIEFVLDILAKEKQEVIILGAFGCGVFGQNPKEVASVFRKLLITKFKNVFRRVVFAIPATGNGNYEEFASLFFGSLTNS